MKPRNARVASALAAIGIKPEITILDADAKTAAAAAHQLGCEVGAIANSLVFDCDGNPLLVMASGAHRVDTALWTAAGTPDSVMPLSYEQLLAITEGVAMQVR